MLYTCLLTKLIVRTCIDLMTMKYGLYDTLCDIPDITCDVRSRGIFKIPNKRFIHDGISSLKTFAPAAIRVLLRIFNSETDKVFLNRAKKLMRDARYISLESLKK